MGYADGLLFYGDRNGRVLGVPFDLNKRRILGASVPLLENVAFTSRRGAYAMLGANGRRDFFYRDLGGNMVSAAVSTKPGFALGKSTHLFAGTAFRMHPGHSEFTVTNDGKRFLMVHPLGKQGMKLVLLRNWTRIQAESR